MNPGKHEGEKQDEAGGNLHLHLDGAVTPSIVLNYVG